jgi:sugar lactone lactonase YvrE
MRVCLKQSFFTGTFSLCILILLNVSISSVRADEHVSLFAEVDASDGLVFDQDNNLYAASYRFGEVYKISPEQEVSLLLDTISSGPAGMIFDEQQNMYIALYNDNTIYRIDASGNSYNWVTGLQGPIGIDFDSTGNLYVANYGGNPTISKISPSGEVSAFVQIDNVQRASSVAIDEQDNVYLVNYFDSQIYKVTPDGEFSLISNGGGKGYGFIIYKNQEFFLTRNEPYQIEKMDMQGNLEIWAGTGISGRQNGPAAEAQFNKPNGIAISEDGLTVMIAEGEVSRVRRIDVMQQGAQVPPYFVGELPASVTQEQTYSATIIARDANNDDLDISVEGLPGWLSFDNSDTISGVPSTSDATGLYEISVTVSDGISATPVVRKSTIQLLPKVVDPVEGSGGGSIGYLLVMLFTLSTHRRKNSYMRTL